MILASPLTSIKGVGPALADKLAGLGLRTVGDLINYYPRRYDDYSAVTPIKQIKPGPVTIKAVMKQATGRYARRGLHVTEAVVSDDTDSVRLVWFNQPYRAKAIKPGHEYYISGTYELNFRRFSIMNPAMELVSDFPISTARIIPIYRETKGLTSRQIRAVLAEAVPVIRELPETLPAWLAKKQKLSHARALEMLHFPGSAEDLAAARERLAFEEVFQLTLASLMNKYELMHEQAPAVPFEAAVAKQFTDSLPFKLTDGQRSAVWQIYQDMARTQPMNRLLEGDVGSGKTLVAAMAAVMVLHSGHQVAIMAPTELLARQHAETFYQVLESSGYSHYVGLLVGGMTKQQKDTARQRMADGTCRLIVGTHAIIQESVDMHNLELVVIDEQHRFGVEQRKKLQIKAGHMPHVLSMTATPIPRSLALTLYGEMDVVILKDKPANRLPIITKITSPNSRKQLYEQIDAQLGAGRQAFIVCPLIADSEMLAATSAETMYERVSKVDFKHRRVGLLHGKMKPAEKNEVMDRFVRHELDILVSTTVIEVGVDVPNATVMLIEGADRFGLAQIHQLRGRVGRSHHQGYCYLMMSDSSEPSRRLRALERSSDGFALAELDLELRGPGAIYGTMQHGQLDLRIAKLSDIQLIAVARKAAQKFIDDGEDLLQYEELSRNIARLRAVTNLN
ncbi:MAG: recG [Candidatus Saccharibacteria bacterium]|nr:recG [Candidatus Saccharibacteria bacterium]